ncbi:MAG TPA: hypothetical protein VN132_13660, partial [Bdellovibrio sp.]|nr:hypothetical protein [Bdellovibrio sp.]
MPRFTIEGVTPAQRQLVAAQFTKAFSLLPPLMQTRLEQKEKFDHYQIKVMDLTSHVGAEINFKGELRISSRYLDKPEMVTRLIIHELSHVYDMLKILPPEILESASRCNGLRGHQPEESLPEVCSLYKGTETTVSTTPEFLDITGWYQTLNGNGDRLSETTFVYRSPDPYEMRSPREMFAVNMEYFLTDPEYKCRRPSLYRVLSKHF